MNEMGYYIPESFEEEDARLEARRAELERTGPNVSDMTLRDYFAGQASSNQLICTGKVEERQLKAWFGEKCGVTREEIAARQALAYADAILAARKKGE